MIKVAPSILSADFTQIGEALKSIELSGADYVHCDVMDGMFVPNITFGQPMIKCIRKKTNLPLDVHLMVDHPERYIAEFAQSGADIITVHVESTHHISRALQQVRACGKKAGIALNPHTPLSVLDYIYDDVDVVMLMSVNPGFGGQKFIRASLEKARDLKKRLAKRGLDVEVQMDGGIGAGNAREVIAAGVDILVAGNAFFSAQDRVQLVEDLRGR